MIDVRVLVKLMCALVLLLVVAILLLQIDAPLDPKAAALLEKAEPAASSDAYLYLMGMVAAQDEAPAEVGRRLLSAIKQAERAYREQGQTFSFQDYPQAQRLPLPEGDLFCQNWTEGCIDRLFAHPAALDDLVSAHDILLQRYQVFMQTADYATLSWPHLAEPFPPFQYLGKANRLWVLSSIVAAETSPDTALAMLQKNIRQLRQQVALQDTLVGRLVMLMAISENLDVASIIMQRSEHATVFALSPLSAQERDFSRVMAREFAMVYDSMRSMDRHPDFLDVDSPLPGWLVRAIYKPNVSANALLPIYLQSIEDAQMTPEAFAQRISSHPNPVPKEDWLRNIAGARLMRFAAPDFNPYLGRLQDLDLKIRLFNRVSSGDSLDAMAREKPVHSTEPYWSADGRSLCMAGALPDERQLRCLRVRL